MLVYEKKMTMIQYENIVETVWLSEKINATVLFDGQQGWYFEERHPDEMVTITVYVDEFQDHVSDLLMKLGFKFKGEDRAL